LVHYHLDEVLPELGDALPHPGPDVVVSTAMKAGTPWARRRSPPKVSQRSGGSPVAIASRRQPLLPGWHFPPQEWRRCSWPPAQTSQMPWPVRLISGPTNRPLLLTRQDCAPAATLAEIRRLATTAVTALGGAAAISDRAANLTPC